MADWDCSCEICTDAPLLAYKTREKWCTHTADPVFSSLLTFGRGWVNRQLYFGDAVGRKATLFGMLSHHGFIGSYVHAINLVRGNVAVQPLNMRAQFVKHAARFL